jgi:hypothetical protein
MKANYQEMEHDLNKGLGFLFGMIGGVTKFVCDVPIHTTEYLKATAEAGFTALVCGFLGVAGKEFYVFLKKKYFPSKHKR